MQNQKHLFDLPEDITYLNGAYMSPQLKSVTKIGIEALTKKAHPHLGNVQDVFFQSTRQVKESFAQLVNIENPKSVAIIPSVSYGTAIVAKNLKCEKGQHIIVIEEQFPSNIYAWQRLAEEQSLNIITIKGENAESINKQLLAAITDNTALVAIGAIHWSNGNCFDCEAIGRKAKAHNAAFVIDGTQSVGALPFDVQATGVDALICGGYKWLMGPYSIGVAYFGEYFNGGIPIEENWINRKDSENFRNLVNYQADYQLGAGRYSMGEQSQMVLAPMLNAAITQLNEWGPANIQAYCDEISRDFVATLRGLGFKIEADAYRAKHLFGVEMPAHIDVSALNEQLRAANIFVSFRGNHMRVAPNVYNTKADFDKLLGFLK